MAQQECSHSSVSWSHHCKSSSTRSSGCLPASSACVSASNRRGHASFQLRQDKGLNRLGQRALQFRQQAGQFGQRGGIQLRQIPP